MPSGNVQKLKILYLMQIFRTETDPDHGLTMPQLVERLAERGVTAERKSLYRDIEILSPDGLREGYVDWLARTLARYGAQA